jgi:hypothetical protein
MKSLAKPAKRQLAADQPRYFYLLALTGRFHEARAGRPEGQNKENVASKVNDRKTTLARKAYRRRGIVLTIA